MTEQLIERIRDHADSEPVPDLDLAGVIRRGRRVRRHRSVARRTIATLAVGAVAGTAFVVATNRDSSASHLTVKSSISASDVKLVSAAYRTGGAFSRGHTLWFSDPDYAVDLGVTIQLMYYTANGVVAGVTNNDAGDVKRDYVYVGTDGSVRELNLPGKVVPGTDAQADRFAYLTKQGSGYEIHVVEASTGMSWRPNRSTRPTAGPGGASRRSGSPATSWSSVSTRTSRSSIGAPASEPPTSPAPSFLRPAEAGRSAMRTAV